MPIVHITKNMLRDMLVEAKEAHTAFEKEAGVPDPDWPAWYASHIIDGLTGSAHDVTVEMKQLADNIIRDIKLAAVEEAFR